MLDNCQLYFSEIILENVHWVDGPKDQGEASDGAEECSGLLVFVLDDTTTVDGELINDNQVGKACHSVPSPLGTFFNGQGSEETSQNHDEIGNDSDEDVGTRQTGEQGEVEK